MSTMNELVQAVNEVYAVAEAHYGRSFKRYPVSLRLKGRTAGKAFLGREIRFNPILYMENKNTFIARTVPHEIAHMIAYDLYGRVKPHGNEWKTVCRKIGMKDITRCHSYDTSTVSKERKPRERPFVYSCNCREFKMTLTLHRRMNAGQRRVCRSCRGILKYVDHASTRKDIAA